MTPAALSTTDFADRAKSVVPAEVWDFVEGGSGAEVTLAANIEAFDLIRVVPRVFSGVASPVTNATLLGTDVSAPLAVAPMAYQRLLHPEGELASARAAKSAGVPFTVSTFSSVSVEDVAATGALTWFQLYWFADRAVTADLVARAEDAGCRTLVLTADLPRMGKRLRDIRNGFTLPADVTAANLPETGRSSVVARHTDLLVDPALCWDDLAWLRARTRLRLVVKGVLDPADAKTAAGAGVDAIVVSNHGGRQLDGAVASAEALQDVLDAVAGRCDVLLDSGVRSGLDVLKAVALGADGVLLGRPVLWGLAADGQRGVADVLALVRDELADAMTLSGCRDVAAIRGLRCLVRSGGRR
ncbi:4-hydroxymandelate oxidase [Lentzea xinjiangensis]|uniref:4-hydroxymandelate oxidase n=1 Tax=Lentzea xinjiangensis TaxID=402600 RepID=A0A1H9SYJ1_9PSEU|nr:alpha-hydroxy acid oxidase [Lentzea xinjiangensis]SER89938.1 4-hydroxymandelate oxidase [Lentzea xinjiangensis]